MSREAYFAENSLVRYFFEDDNIKTMNKQIHTNVKCVCTLDSRMKDPYGKEEYGGTQWFLRQWDLLKNTTWKDKFLEDMHDILKLDESHHFQVSVVNDEHITNVVVFYIEEILTALAIKYEMTLQIALETRSHYSQLYIYLIYLCDSKTQSNNLSGFNTSGLLSLCSVRLISSIASDWAHDL